jgi:hypothetical protein
MSYFSFRHHALVIRKISRIFKEFVESKIKHFCPHRELHYNMKPGYVYPTRNNKLIQLPNVVHLTLYHYFPDYNQWLFNYMLNRDLHVTMDSLNHRRTTFCFTIFRNKKIKYLKMMNLGIVGLYLNGIVMRAERICFRNVVFSKTDHEIVKSECKYFTMKACSNIQHL